MSRPPAPNDGPDMRSPYMAPPPYNDEADDDDDATPSATPANNAHDAAAAPAVTAAARLQSRPMLRPSPPHSSTTPSINEPPQSPDANAASVSPDEAEIARLRAAVTARMTSNLQRAKANLAAQQQQLYQPQSDTLSPAVGRSTSSSQAPRRPSPIKEEHGTVSPLTAAFSSPLATTQTASTESTSSSSRTIRGSAAATPAAVPLRTPSYPFPYVPGTPRTWSSAFHQPFTALSPTVSAAQSGDSSTPGGAAMSGATTPAATGAAFAPQGFEFGPSQDPRFPTPNVYDLVLQLNSEPGLDAWWSTVANIMNDVYKADRTSLALPADSNDIENVPWGQKATFNVSGREDSSNESQASNQPPPSISALAPRSDPSTWSRMRPNLETRHSYAGHTTVDSPHRPGSALRPNMPSRTVSHAPSLMNAPMPSPGLDYRMNNYRSTSVSDPEFSSVGGYSQPAQLAVYPVLKGLESEVDGLIDSSGINRVLERGKLITLTRDYSNNGQDSQSSSNSSLDENTVSGQRSTKPKAQQPPPPPPPAQTPGKASQLFGNSRTLFSQLDNNKRRGSVYEEYEQYPPSPWAQSPAPSPAMQADPDNNPFFTAEESVEDSFNPTEATHDYSHLEPVEAIGVDRAHTVVHIPLIHPTLSPIMHNFPTESPNPESRPASRAQSVSQVSSGDRRAPIAILSVLSPAVPYPQNLIQSLKLLGPHLATSYYMAHQYTNAHNQAMGVRHRRSISGHNVGFAPLNIAPGNLDDLIRADLDEVAGSISGSMTSPSDYSGRSRHSPSGSIVGTPGWDPSAFGLNSNSRSVVNTPAGLRGTEIIDSYFDAKKMHRATSTAGNQTSSVTPAKERSKRVSMTTADEEQMTPKSERRSRQSRAAKEDKPPVKTAGREPSPPRTTDNSILRKPSFRSSAPPPTIVAESEDKRHSYLHSYGADFSSSFQGLPAATTPGPKTPGVLTHIRASSVSDEMPPPSERLLRTIIDSLPVQIFTAAPGSGALTWVNSKFLVYRGHDSRQVLKEPWQAIHQEDKNKYMDSWNRSLRTGQQLQQKIRLQRFDGNYRWFYVRAAPLKDKKQNIVHWIGTNMDFHEQHLAEVNLARQQETAASEAKYRALANSSPQVVFTVNKSKGVTFCNSQWLNYSGQSESQALGIGFMEHVHPDDIVKCRLPAFDNDSTNATNVPTTMPPEPHRTMSSSAQSSSASSDTERAPTSPMHTSPTTQLPQARLSQLASTGILKVSRDADGKPSYSTEVRLRSKDGEYRWHLVRVLLAERDLQDDEEETWYGTCTDINDHKALERDLKETMDEKSRFLSNMSHEIRTPLNGITGMVNFLIDSSLTSEQMEHVNIIRASTEGLRGLINDILDLSKAEAGMIQLNMDWMHVRSLIEEVNDLTSAMAIDKGLELNYLVEPNVPSQIKGDRFRIRQILLNVIGNAIKFTMTGEVFVRCSVPLEEEYQPTDDSMYVQFEIMDTGQGFTEKEAQYLFKRFSQIDGSSTRQHGGTGLGLVISRQLAQLHGGDMSARGVPGKGATFAFVIKTSLPAGDDKPPPPPPATPGLALLPNLPATSLPASTITQDPRLSNTLNIPFRDSPKLMTDASDVSSPDFDRISPVASSSGSSDPSIRGTVGSAQSVRSSASSFVPDPSLMSLSPPIELAIPTDGKSNLAPSDANAPSSAIRMVTPGGSHLPPMYSILVVCPLKHARDATVQHMDMTLPKNIPHKITARENVLECQKMIGGDDPMIFSHIVLVLQSVPEIIAFVQQVLASPPHSLTQVVLITDLQQRRKLVEQAPQFDDAALAKERRMQFIFKPLKPSKFAAIFDPRKEREMSTDRNQDSAQQVAVSQKQVYEEMIRRLGNKNKRVLLVEDNRVNQMVLLKFLSKVNVKVDTVLDGVQCTEKVFANPHGYYSIILCDLHMPNKDGYQTCREIRKWEKKNKEPYIPIVALSANVMGDVYAKCVDAGFNSYVTKPVDFKELSTVMLTYLDPSDPNQPIEFMKQKK